MMSRSGFFAGLVREWLHLRGRRGCALLILIAVLMPVAGRAQDVAEAARQEKARKAAQGTRQSHVYTNEDLHRAEILSREESAAVEGRPKNSDGASVSASVPTNGATPSAKSATSAANAPALDAGEKVVMSESLGEVARRYRREKEARQAERASANLPASQFHLEVTRPALAEIAPRRVLSGSAIASSLPATRSIQPKNSGIPAKRDPFLRPGLGQLEIANRPATNGSRMALPIGLPAKKIVEPNASGSGAAVRRANHGADDVAGMTRGKDAPATIANGISIPSRLRSRPVVAPIADDSIVVRAGDSLWNLSRRYSGAGARWRGWLAANPGIEEKRLRPGMRLVRPGSTPALAPRVLQQTRALEGQLPCGRGIRFGRLLLSGTAMGSCGVVLHERIRNGAMWRRFIPGRH